MLSRIDIFLSCTNVLCNVLHRRSVIYRPAEKFCCPAEKFCCPAKNLCVMLSCIKVMCHVVLHRGFVVLYNSFVLFSCIESL